MKNIRFISAFLTLSVFIGYVLAPHILAADSPAYKALSQQDPIYVSAVSIDSVGEFYASRTTNEILSDKENNYIHDYVSVGGKKTLCHVYMRTFDISDISSYSRKVAEEKSNRFLTQVKDAISDKYVKCVVRNYSITVSVKSNPTKDIYTQMTVRLMLALGESNSQRTEVVEKFVKPNADAWASLPVSDKVTALNSFILNGQFTYDTEMQNRSSVYQFITEKKGVCEEYAGLTSLFLDYMGFENVIVTGRVSSVKHMWNMVKINARWYHLDILWNGPVDKNGVHSAVTDTYLLRSTESISQTHTPDPYYSRYTSAAIYDYRFGQVPTEIVSDLYEIENGTYIHMPILTTVEFFKNSLGMGEFIEVKKNGRVLADHELIGSEYTVELNVNGQVLQTLTACVVGDVTSDGMTSDDDITVVKEFILGKRLQTRDVNLQRYMCDINRDGLITVSDLFMFINLAEQTSPTPPDQTDAPSQSTSPSTSPTSDAVPPETTHMTTEVGA